jgi:dihydrofolate reductase
MDVVDEYRLTVYPYLAAGGPSLFADLASSRRLELASSTTFASGVLALTYRRAAYADGDAARHDR